MYVKFGFGFLCLRVEKPQWFDISTLNTQLNYTKLTFHCYYMSIQSADHQVCCTYSKRTSTISDIDLGKTWLIIQIKCFRFLFPIFYHKIANALITYFKINTLNLLKQMQLLCHQPVNTAVVNSNSARGRCARLKSELI